MAEVVNFEQTRVASELDNCADFPVLTKGTPAELASEVVKTEILPSANRQFSPVQKEKHFMSSADRVGYPIGSLRGRLLIVDDEPVNRELLSDILASEGYDVVTAQDGLDALNRLVEPLPDVIISDLRMPRMSGFEFLAVVRRKYPDVPLIAISGEFEGNEVPPGVPADAYLPKGSYTFDQLRTKITDLLSAPPRKPGPAASGFVPV